MKNIVAAIYQCQTRDGMRERSVYIVSSLILRCILLLVNSDFFFSFLVYSNIVPHFSISSFLLFIFSSKTISPSSMQSGSQCFWKTDGPCSDILSCLYELRHERFSSMLFPGAQSCIEIMLLRSDLFYQTAIRLRKTNVCTKHKDFLLKEFRRSVYRTCCVCVPCFGKSKANAAVQNIEAPIALTLYEQFRFEHSYGKLICRRCRGEVVKRIDSVR